MDMSIFVCDDEPKADEAIGLLKGMGYADGGISKEQVDTLNYDAARWDGGSHDHILEPKWIVIGRN